MRRTRPVAGLLLALALVHPALAADEEREESRPVLEWTPEEQVEQRLAESRALAGSKIRAAGNETAISLRGTVRDAGQRQRALHLAAPFSPGPVKDELRVDATAPLPGAVPDGDLARAVAERLTDSIVPDAKAARGWDFGWRVAAEGWGVDVEVDDGDVSLDGKVPLQQHIHQMILAARDVAGVRSVRARIDLVPIAAPKDELHP
jgi:osmotically-inducible protein OsmY